MRACVGIASVTLLALLAACSGAGASPTPTPTPRAHAHAVPTSTPTPATPRSTGLLVREPESFEGYTLYAHGLVYLIDHVGQLVHAWEAPQAASLAKLLNNGNLLLKRNIEIDPDGNVVWEYRHYQHHDLLKLPNGNVLFLSGDIIPSEEAIALGANPDLLACPLLRATSIVEVRPTGPTDGEIVWRWSALDHLVQDFDPEKPNYGAVADHPQLIDVNFAQPAMCVPSGRADWLHSNGLDYNAELDQIMITVRHFGEIWIIDRSTSMEEAAGHAGGNAGKGGDLLYRWGNPRAYRRGTAADQRLFWPHNAHWIPEGLPGAGNVLIFNNGAENLGFERGYSSADEFALPADGYNYRLESGSAYGPNELVWRYAADPPESFYAPLRSNAQRLPNGATLIADGVSARIFEVTREGETVWEFAHIHQGENFLSRSYRYAPDHPGIQNLFAPYRAARSAAAAGDPIARSVFDLYLTNDDLVYVKESCGQSDTEHSFFLHIAPERVEDLPPERRRHGFSNVSFDFLTRGAALDGECVARIPLPDYPVAAIRTGQRSAQGGADLWSASFRLDPEPYRAIHRAAASTEPVARSVFDVHLADGALLYVKEPCEQADTDARFFLHVVPQSADDLQEDRREYGFNGLDFDFFLNGAWFDGKCAARVPLPDYPAASVRTGQHVSGVRELWSAEFAVVGGGAPPP